MDHLTAQGNRLGIMFSRFFDRSTVTDILALALPAVRLTPAGLDSGSPLKTSRFGGVPVLPPGMSWPYWGRRPLHFLGVIDFGEVAEATGVTGLPERLTAGFFYASDIPRPWGDDPAESDGWRVLSVANAALLGVPSPAGVTGSPELMLSASAFLSLPGPDERALRGIGDDFGRFDHVYGEIYRAWLRYVWPDRTPRHQIGGWQVPVQGFLGDGRDRARGLAAPEPETPPERGGQWRLLLQLDSDDRLDWFWGDEGHVCFSARTGETVAALDDCWLTLRSR